MPIDSCLVPVAGMTFGEIFYCIGLLTFGSIQLAGIVFFICVSYIMWKAGLPIQVTAPLSAILLFALGAVEYAAYPVFTNLLWLLILGAAVLFVLALIHFARR